VDHVGEATIRKVIQARAAARAIIETLGGKAAHPVMGLPGGVSRRPPAEVRAAAARAAELGREVIKIGRGILAEGLARDGEHDEGHPPGAVLPTYYLSLVGDAGQASYVRGTMRVVGPDGAELARFEPRDYLAHIAEHVESHDYMKRPYLRQVGWAGRVTGADSGLFRVGPLARINVVDSMVSPAAERERQELLAHFGGAPVHHTKAYHWARLVECLEACERLELLGTDPVLDEAHIRNPPGPPRREGIAAVEAPRGTLVHHYNTDEDGILTGVNLVVATVQNSVALDLSVEQAARGLIRNGKVPDERLLNRVEMAFRAYDPCLACATHALPGGMPLCVRILDPEGKVLREVMRNGLVNG
jgi:F420-non-reducing hydrogenase large subunit